MPCCPEIGRSAVLNVGIDIGGTKIAGGVVDDTDASSSARASPRRWTPASSPTPSPRW
jgi:hypothetical protein